MEGFICVARHLDKNGKIQLYKILDCDFAYALDGGCFQVTADELKNRLGKDLIIKNLILASDGRVMKVGPIEIFDTDSITDFYNYRPDVDAIKDAYKKFEYSQLKKSEVLYNKIIEYMSHKYFVKTPSKLIRTNDRGLLVYTDSLSGILGMTTLLRVVYNVESRVFSISIIGNKKYVIKLLRAKGELNGENTKKLLNRFDLVYRELFRRKALLVSEGLRMCDEIANNTSEVTSVSYYTVYCSLFKYIVEHVEHGEQLCRAIVNHSISIVNASEFNRNDTVYDVIKTKKIDANVDDLVKYLKLSMFRIGVALGALYPKYTKINQGLLGENGFISNVMILLDKGFFDIIDDYVANAKNFKMCDYIGIKEMKDSELQKLIEEENADLNLTKKTEESA